MSRSFYRQIETDREETEEKKKKQKLLEKCNPLTLPDCLNTRDVGSEQVRRCLGDTGSNNGNSGLKMNYS